MSTFGSSPQSGPGTNDHAPVDPVTSPDTEPDADLPPTEPSLDASELEDGDDDTGEQGEESGSGEADVHGDPDQVS